MTTFWKQLQGLALGQLFNGGYLSVEAACKQANPEAKADDTRARTNDPIRRPPHVQIAAYR
jgi:hypothetical protein